TIEGGEACEPGNLGGLTCADVIAGSSGVLGCNANCSFDVSGCSSCGNGVVEPGEVCDKGPTADSSDDVLGGESCASRGYDGGSLACNSSCTGFDEAGCADCGGGVMQGPGSCDPGGAGLPADLGGQTCVSEGFDGGTLKCRNNCTL